MQTTRNDSVTNMILFGILLILATFTVYNVMQDNAEQTQDAIDRCVEATQGSMPNSDMRIYCTQVYSE